MRSFLVKVVRNIAPYPLHELSYNEFAEVFFQGAKAHAELNRHQLRIPGNLSNTLRT